MMDLQDRPEVGWNILSVLAIAVVIGAVWFGFYATPAAQTESAIQALKRANAATLYASDRAVEARKDVEQQTWKMGVETLGSKTLERLTKLAEVNKVQLSGFRTERSSDVPGLAEAQFVAVAEGAFPDVLAFVKRVEAPDTKLSVELLQMSASDATPGQVSATIGMVSYVIKEAK